MGNGTYLKTIEQGIRKSPGVYGFYTKDSDGSQIEVGKTSSAVPTIYPGSDRASEKKSGMRKVIHTTGGY